MKRREVLGHLLLTDVLEHADRRNSFERLAANVAVVLDADIDLIRQSRLRYALSRQVGLSSAEGHPDHLRVVVGRGVKGHRSPPAANVEEPRAGALVETELAADELVLCGLRLLEARLRGRENGTRVRHRRPEHQAVEVVADVVVVRDRLGIALAGVERPRSPLSR